MKKHRVATTISQKHWDLLNKQVEKFGTQQKVLEFALENMGNSSKQGIVLTEEEELLIRLKRAKSACTIEKNALKLLIEIGDIEPLQKFFAQKKIVEYAIEFHFQKSFKECSLKEVIDGLVIIAKLCEWFDTVDYADNDSYYTLIMAHSFGPNASKISIAIIESVFKTYGVKIEIKVSPMTIFTKIYKK